MPLTEKGKKILRRMKKPKSKGGYGADKGESVFHASAKKGTIKGVEKSYKNQKRRKAKRRRSNKKRAR